MLRNVPKLTYVRVSVHAHVVPACVYLRTTASLCYTLHRCPFQRYVLQFVAVLAGTVTRHTLEQVLQPASVPLQLFVMAAPDSSAFNRHAYSLELQPSGTGLFIAVCSANCEQGRR